MSRRVVVAAAIVAGNRLLLGRRGDPAEMAGRWELPGGKVRPGEDPSTALCRELDEELGVQARVGDRIGDDVPVGTEYVLRAYRADIVAGTPVARAHTELRWVDAAELAAVDLLDADRVWLTDLRALLG
ncbi:(deoxy)nucleoside triphosphate pyrophosphohydrolase [Skermania piniformis]|uniref:8-oxo-dGTP diphosphatase n=1 Tax=Skermania pinensis TaxID=39122 RepID=A0ABX8S5Q7_9ACTN|nr:NUDIX domain-containing protein [Skermania piniformis]QXQ13173.1 NUDIX domain-containing protein [Skermania piniformis]